VIVLNVGVVFTISAGLWIGTIFVVWGVGFRTIVAYFWAFAVFEWVSKSLAVSAFERFRYMGTYMDTFISYHYFDGSVVVANVKIVRPDSCRRLLLN